MTLLLVRNSKSSYSLYSPDTYGMETWGMTTQRSIIKKSKHWYTNYWSAGCDWADDYLEEHKLNVVLETISINEVVRYLIDKKAKCINEILDEFKEIVDDYVSFTKWVIGGNQS